MATTKKGRKKKVNKTKAHRSNNDKYLPTPATRFTTRNLLAAIGERVWAHREEVEWEVRTCLYKKKEK